MLDRTHVTVEQRAFFLQVAKEAGAASHLIEFRISVSECVSRIKARTSHPGGKQTTGKEGAKLAQKTANIVVWPSYSEGFEEIVTVTDEATLVEARKAYATIGAREKEKYAPLTEKVQKQQATVKSVSSWTTKMKSKLASTSMSPSPEPPVC